MKKFKFRLEKVLDYRVRLYEIARANHAEALRILKREELVLEGLNDEYRSCLDELARVLRTVVKARDLGPYYRYMTYLKKEIMRQTKVVQDAAVKEEEQRRRLMKAAQDKEVLIKIKEKQYNDYRYGVRQEEQKFLDDITASKYARVGGGV